MRGVSLSLALIGAVIAAGCGGGASPGQSGGARGVAEGTFTVTIQNGQNGNAALAISAGYVTSTPAGIDCGVPPHDVCSFDFTAKNADGTPAAVTLTATAVGTGKLFLGWAGDCTSLTNVCTVTGAADQYVLARFGTEADRMGHPNWSSPAVHEAAMKQILTTATLAGTYQCDGCHGAKLTGAGLAPSCFAASCHAAGTLHDEVANDSLAYDGIPADATGGPRVTAVCITCHATRAAELMGTQHWTWRGPTPQLFDVGADFQATTRLENPGTIGKANYVNNYCVSVASNERRCDQCHAGYGNPGTNLSARTATMANDPSRVDCLICHSSSVTGNMASGGYNKIAGAFGAAGSAVGPGTPWATAAQLKAWSTAPQRPTRENCGWCHFNGGGADSVKIMGTQLRTPAVTTDVHMSPDTANGGQNMVCADCHSSGHAIKGAGIHVPTNTARLACSDCHGEAPHASSALNGHTASIACETCHIPAFSRAMPQKTDWDWSTAGWKTAAFPHPATIYACVLGTTESPYDNSNCSTIAGSVRVKKYDYMKGTFAWGQNVKPSYRWYNGTMTHVTTDDKGAFTIETGLTPASRITLSAPLGARGNGKIFPFKIMTGRQAVYVDDAAGGSFVITPNLFHDPADGTDGGFWGVISAQPPSTTHAYAYLGTVTPDAFGAPNAPLAGSFVLNQTATFTGTSFGGYTVNPAADTTVQYSIETLLSKAFTKGAIAAGQAPAGTATFARYAGPGTTGWDWRFTRMFLDLEHEVAPASRALGAGGNCAACHGATPAIPICELYAGGTLPWGVTCP